MSFKRQGKKARLGPGVRTRGPYASLERSKGFITGSLRMTEKNLGGWRETKRRLTNYRTFLLRYGQLDGSGLHGDCFNHTNYSQLPGSRIVGDSGAAKWRLNLRSSRWLVSSSPHHNPHTRRSPYANFRGSGHHETKVGPTSTYSPLLSNNSSPSFSPADSRRPQPPMRSYGLDGRLDGFG